MQASQIPSPPIGMMMPEAYHTIVVATFLVLGLVFVILLNEARRHRSVVPVLMMLGGMTACLTEPL